MTPKKIPVATWAAQHYDPPPSAWVLRKWCRAGEFWPPVDDVAAAAGRRWWIGCSAECRRPNAEVQRRAC